MALKLDSGLQILFYPESRTPEEFVADAQDQASTEASDWPFSLVPLRGVTAEVADTHQGPTYVGPAAVSWVEDGYLVSILGFGGQRLPELVDIAGAM
ncbi:MAG: hypothetical protein HYU54_07295 [Actinobacteria bacterium]|nr:hypothetical protein [Actinomycetota bacterium]